MIWQILQETFKSKFVLALAAGLGAKLAEEAVKNGAEFPKNRNKCQCECNCGKEEEKKETEPWVVV